MIGAIKTVAVYVSDQANARAFYTEMLGFEVRKEIPMTPDAAWLEVAPAGAQSALVLYPRAMMKNWQELKPSVVFHCDDVDRTVAEVESKGVAITDRKTNRGAPTPKSPTRTATNSYSQVHRARSL